MLIKAARLWDGVSPELLHNAFVRIQGGQIVAIGRQEELGESSEGQTAEAEVYDLGDCTILPGLINMHAHITFNASQTLLADYFREKEAGLPTLTLRAVDNLQRALRVGVTTLRDCGTLNEVIFPVRAAIESGLLAGPRLIASGTTITTTGGHCYYFGHECDNADEIRKAVRYQHKAGADFIKIFATGGNLTPGSDPVVSQYSAAEMLAATEEARKLGKGIASHAHGTEGVRSSVAARVTTIEHCTFMTSGGVEYDPEIAEEIARAGIYVVPTLSINLTRQIQANPNYAKDNPKIARWVATREKRAENFRRLVNLGVTLVSGSDSGIPGVTFDDFPADLSVTVKEVGLSPYQTLISATSNAAKACGFSDTGVLTSGKRADLLVVAGNPLENIEALQATRLVVAKGRLAFHQPQTSERVIA